MGIANQFVVAMADLAVSQDPNLILATSPLGACLGLAIYDPVSKIGGMLHSMLPDSSIDPQRAATRPGMFMDTGLIALLKGMDAAGARREDLLIYVAGGAQVMDETSYFNIGKRNYDVLLELLNKQNLHIRAEDVGGLTNRTMQIDLETGEVRLKFSGQVKMKVLCKR